MRRLARHERHSPRDRILDDPSEYTFRTSTQIETAATDLGCLNKGIFISVGGRQAASVIYKTYLVI